METQLLILIAVWCGDPSQRAITVPECREKLIKCVQDLAHGEPTSICFGVRK